MILVQIKNQEDTKIFQNRNTNMLITSALIQQYLHKQVEDNNTKTYLQNIIWDI